MNIPFDFAAWLAGQGTTYVSHNLTPADGLQATTVSAVAGVVVVQVSAAGPLEVGLKYGVTCQIIAADGQKRSKTLYLKIKEL
ncbi:MAG: hypothetical protein V4724_26570 [Pseudomonadota bacterium]